ncbi:hypothetical protein PIB30_073819 [Stylosanthes scabra]|uniref:Uncharacterized protein n=1 Tax=Stylosanthes scabra TaxID=79078 RepID=A0ABU6YM32_9FABA|nr:hypothetical protein [Stylosanthes scabra]
MRRYLRSLGFRSSGFLGIAYAAGLSRWRYGCLCLDRTRLALKAFTDQKSRFFPHLDYGLEANESASKKLCGSVESTVDPKEESSILKMLPDVLNYPGSNKLRLGSLGTVATEKVAVIEMSVPSTFRGLISLHPAGSTDPDDVAFFAPEVDVYEFKWKLCACQGVFSFQFIMYLVISRIMQPHLCNIFLGTKLNHLCIVFCTGFAATRLCFQDHAANVPVYLPQINNLLFCCLQCSVLIGSFPYKIFYQQFPQKTILQISLLLIMLAASLRNCDFVHHELEIDQCMANYVSIIRAHSTYELSVSCSFKD